MRREVAVRLRRMAKDSKHYRRMKHEFKRRRRSGKLGEADMRALRDVEATP